MRTSVLLRHALLFLAIASPAFVLAQFQPPTDAELKMTADPKAPGAAAVYLNREETTDDKLHVHGYYERIKVLSEKGKEYATIRIPYEHGEFKVTDIQGRTIHSDGTIVPLTTKPADLVDVKSSTRQVNTMVFTLPSVEVGSILEYRLNIRYDDNMVSSPTWEIQQPLFVHKVHYSFKPADQSGSRYISNGRGQTLDHLMYAAVSIPKEKVAHDIAGRYSVDLTDIEPLPADEWMTPLNTIRQRVEFYYTYATTGKEFWDSEGKHWAKEAASFTNPGSEIKKAVAEMVAPTDTEEQKARKIYDAVMKLDNTAFSRKKSEAERKAEHIKAIKNAEDVWKQRSGSDDDIALLYVALARAAGLKAYPMQVVDRNRAFFDSSFMSAGQLDDYIAIVEIGGQDVFLDPGQKMCPFGLLHWKHTLAAGFRLSDKGADLANTLPITYKQAVTKRTANLEIGADGSVKGTVTIVMAGPEALRWRQLAVQNDPEEVKKQFNESLREEVPDGVQAELDHFLGLETPATNLLAMVTVSGSLGTATGKRYFLPGQFFQSHAAHPFVAQAKRLTPVDVHYGRTQQDDVTYHLPAGYATESTLLQTSLNWPDHAMLKIASTAKDNAVEVVRVFAHNYSLLEPKDYNDLHDYYLKIAAADQQQIVLTRAAAAKGNGE